MNILISLTLLTTACATVATGAQCRACAADEWCVLDTCAPRHRCVGWAQFGPGPPSTCPPMTDPNARPKSKLESWLTRELFDDLFPKANIGHGPHACAPFNYDAFVIAARYFPSFGTSAPANGFTATENAKRDVAAFLAHAIQETGENDAHLYKTGTKAAADACFYRGGFFNWFEGGPVSSFLDPANPGSTPAAGDKCNAAGRYCDASNTQYPCAAGKDGAYFNGCYFGRGAIQISYNYNYGQFRDWLRSVNIDVDVLAHPNLVMTHRDPPLAIMASLWFYMTPQPPKPAMHDIVLGTWEAGAANRAAGYAGAIFGPTSLVINNECGGEDAHVVGGPGESRRIKAFKWFAEHFGFGLEPEKLLTCKGMPKLLDQIAHAQSFGPDWSTTWRNVSCTCVPVAYAGSIAYYAPTHYPRHAHLNAGNKRRCEALLYARPEMFGLRHGVDACLSVRPDGAPATAASAAPPLATDVETAPPLTADTVPPVAAVTVPPTTTAATAPPNATATAPPTTTATTPPTSATMKTTPAKKPVARSERPSRESDSFECPTENGNYVDPTDCGRFYACVDGVTVARQRCPAGLHFSATTRACDWPANARCRSAAP